MSSYFSSTGVISAIEPAAETPSDYGCRLLVSLRSYNLGIQQFIVSGNTYIVDHIPFNTGDRVTFFCDSSSPAVLSYPPRYHAVAAANAGQYQYYLGEFQNDLISTDGQFQINNSVPLPMYLPNGLVYSGTLAGKPVLVEYLSSTRSIPALITPQRIIVFCF